MQAAKEQAKAAEMQSEYQARALEFNAGQARGEAEAVSRQGAAEQEALARRQRAVAASGRAAAGASGLLLDSGTAANVEAGTELQAAADRDVLRQNYQRQRFGLVNQAVGLEHQANGARAGGAAYASAVENAGRAALTGSLLTSAGTVAAKWDDMAVGRNGLSMSSKEQMFLYPDFTTRKRYGFG
ncbi:hypothetical protein BED41_03495 [Cloacibacillus porcorum]|uniref:Uncharacterized protein n=2 Tax=Cloacibacillus porcorum TaxID=1197717 RepID=A0A1B2I2M9_9BACT|nr:hypothetical protein BED41_03495 [Cloacibacillus porcorum]